MWQTISLSAIAPDRIHRSFLPGMQIRFVYTSSPVDDPVRIDAILAALPAECETQQIDAATPQIEISDADQLVIAIVVDLSDAGAGAEPIRIATAAVQLFAQLATRFRITWEVGHELDPHLGTIVGDAAMDELIDEVKTAVEVARSLADLIVDDEFVEPDAPVMESDDSDDRGDATWEELFQPPDSFIRFPEFD
ncbi:hypothetical protein Enr13x_15880 [Stieleria neptunia]|uniref:Uncharacterized protein n=1 Tax=Stieleria neptunia TaxID=2527979 RepID=A0A518HLM2_9BACT|nr:hypothetical protein [Stieleria neptunia]QDV41745.1 hypothetical protein Enr13x_15880 [Stieleria neptunia]